MRREIVFICVALICFSNHHIGAKTVFRRTDKISDNFKQLNLPAEEIDPNVGPLEPQKIETIDPEDANVSGTSASEPSEENAVDADDALAEANQVVVDEELNEIDGVALAAAENGNAEAQASPDSAAATSAVSTAAPATVTAAPVKNEDDPNALSKYCKCTDSHCDCCRNFNLPLIPVRGPGCAKITYLGNERMSVSIKYGDITLATRTVSGKNAKPICVGLPGGYSKFCGRVYGLSKAKENFKACLGFELRAEDEVEAALRVSCFKFGPEGLRVAEPEPLPVQVNKDEDEDDDGIFGFAAGGDEDDEDDYDADEEDDEEEPDNDNDDDDDTEIEPPEDADYGGFSLGAFLDELDDDDEDGTAVKPSVAAPITSAISPTIDQTRNVQQKSDAQSKDDKGTGAGATTADETGSQNSVPVENNSVPEVTPAPDAPTVAGEPVTPANVKKTKKSKKNKKKKAANSDDTGLALEIINGILDFFN